MRQPGPCVCASCDSGALLQRWHVKFHTSNCILHTSYFAFTLHRHTPHFISSHVTWSLLASSQLFSSHLISCHISSKYFSTAEHEHFLSCLTSHCARLHVAKLLLPGRDLARKNQCAEKLLHTEAWNTEHLNKERICTWEAFTDSSFTQTSICTQHALHTGSWYTHKAFTRKPFTHSRLLHTANFYTKLVQSTSQYYLVLQSLHKVRRSTSLYYNKSLHKARPSTSLPKEFGRAKLPTIWTDGKHSQEEIQTCRKSEWRR